MHLHQTLWDWSLHDYATKGMDDIISFLEVESHLYQLPSRFCMHVW